MIEQFVPIFGILVPFTFTAIIVVAIFYFRYLRRMETEKTIRMALEHGQQLSPELLEKLMDTQRPHSPQRMKRTGIIMVFVGLGLFAMNIVSFINSDDVHTVGPGALVTLIGLGILVAGHFTKPDDTKK